MADEFSIAERTAFDDCAHLRKDLHAPVAFNTERGGWYYTEAAFALPLLYLNGSEAAALRRSLLAAREFLGEAEAEPLRHLSARLSPHVPGVSGKHRESVGGAVHATGDAGTSDQLLADAGLALMTRRKLDLLYNGAHRGEQTERMIRPYHLHNHQGEWYLLAHCELRNELRTFLLGRVEQWRLQDEEAAYLIPTDFDGEALIAQGFHLMYGAEPVTVRIRFDAYQARWIRERTYHPSQLSEQQLDGSLIVMLTVAGTAEVKRWVMSYGRHAEVLEPLLLREEIAQDMVDILDLYRCHK